MKKEIKRVLIHLAGEDHIFICPECQIQIEASDNYCKCCGRKFIK